MNTSKQINIIVLLIFASIIATGAYTMWDPGRADSAKDRQLETTIERGAFLFSQNCRSCHGDSGEGGQASNRLKEAPPLNRPDLQGKQADGSVDENDKNAAYDLVFNTINCGRVGKAMPTWGVDHGGVLNAEQIRQLSLLITEGTGWEHAKEFAVEGFPRGEVHGDAEVPFHLARAVSESDTTIPLGGDISTLAAGERLQLAEELVSIESVNVSGGSVTVVRGLGSTKPAAHEVGVEMLKVPVPPDPAPITEQACGQLPQAAPTAVPQPPSATLTIASQGIAWDKTEMNALPDVPLTLTHNHNDPGQTHNWALFRNEDSAGDPEALIAATELEQGPATQTLNFGPLAAGDYYYQCDAHPQMNGILHVLTLDAFNAATAGGGAAATPGAGGTPEAGTTPEAGGETPAATVPASGAEEATPSP